MTRVICSNYDCLHCDPRSYYCQKDVVSVGDDYSYGCEDYVAYNDCEEYREKFFRAVKTKSGQKAKAVAYGKKIEYNGKTFFTSDRVTEDGNFVVTDGRTGFLVSQMAMAKDRWEQFLEAEKREPDVETLPLAVKVKGGYVLVGSCTGERCPMQTGFQTDACEDKECPYRTEVEE